jgi:hypothetical protein
MSYKTLEVELENGVVRPAGSEILPAKAHALLTILTPAMLDAHQDDGSSPTTLKHPSPAKTSAELAEYWSKLDRLPPDEANAFADDIEAAHRSLPPLKSAWD